MVSNRRFISVKTIELGQAVIYLLVVCVHWVFVKSTFHECELSTVGLGVICTIKAKFVIGENNSEIKMFCTSEPTK